LLECDVKALHALLVIYELVSLVSHVVAENGLPPFLAMHHQQSCHFVPVAFPPLYGQPWT